SLDDLSNSLLQASAFGIAGAIPVLGAGDTGQARADLIAQGDSVVKEMNGRLQRIAKLAPTPDTTPAALRDYEVARLHELFGPDFQVVLWVTPQNANALKNSFANTVSLQGQNPLESITWFQRIACVRDGAARLHAALQYGEAVSTGATLALQVG